MTMLRGPNPMMITELDEPELDALTGKFHPNRMKCSAKLTALLARLLGGYRWTDPAIVELILTSDTIMAREEGDIGANSFIGAPEDFTRNLRGVVDAAGVTNDERIRLAVLFSNNVTDHRSGIDFFKVLGLK